MLNPYLYLYRFFKGMAIILLIWIGYFGYFVLTLEHTPQDFTTKVDGIVVLTGGHGRIAEGLDLFHKKLGRELFISGVHKGVDAKQLANKQHLSHNAKSLLKDTHLGYEAQNTIENAQEIAEWIQENHIQSVRLVTADYHMKRSIRELLKLAPDIKIIAHPVQQISKLNWSSFKRLWREYVKLTIRFYIPISDHLKL